MFRKIRKKLNEKGNLDEVIENRLKEQFTNVQKFLTF